MSTGGPLAVLTEESEHQLTVLRRAMKRTARFALYVVVAKDLGRVELLRRLRAWSGIGGVPEFHFFPEGRAGALAVDKFLAAKDTVHAPAGAVIADGEALIDADEGNALAALNVARDVLDEVIRGPLLLILSPEREADLARRAPDLFDVRAGTVVVVAMVVDSERILVTEIADEERGPARSMAQLQREAARLRALARSVDPPLGALSDGWVRLGSQFLGQGDAGEAIEAAKAAQRLAEQAKYSGGLANGLGLEARVLSRTGELVEAQAAHEKALAIYESLGNRWGVAESCHQLGIVAQTRLQFDEACAWYEKSLPIREELGHRLGMAASYHQLGTVAQQRGELDKAQRWHEQARAIVEELGNRSGMAASYHQLGTVAQERGELDKARIWFEQSLIIEEKRGDRTGMAATYHHLGTLALAQGALATAQSWYEKSLALHEELGHRPRIAMSYGQMGILAESRNDLVQALDWTVRAIALFPEFPHPITVPAPGHLARLTYASGMPALEASWQRVTGQPLPADVRSYVEARIRDAETAVGTR